MQDGHVPRRSVVLQRLYPTPMTLKDAILLLTDSDSQREAPVPKLTKNSDTREYLEDFLQGYRVAFPSGTAALNGTYTLQQRSSQAEILDRSIAALLHRGGCAISERNILCLGYQKKKPAKKKSSGGITEACHMNSSIQVLTSEPWQLLLSRIGDALMLHLLVHTAIFKPLPNGCYMQLTGAPADQVAKKLKPDAQDTAALLNPAATSTAGDLACLAPGTQAFQVSQPCTQGSASPGAISEASGASEEGQACQGMPPGLACASDDVGSPPRARGRHARRSARPSSWQRRRAARLRQAQALQNASGLVTDQAHTLCEKLPRHQHISPAAVNQHSSGQGTPSRPTKRPRIVSSGCADEPQRAAATQALADTPIELWSYASAAQDATSAAPSSGPSRQPPERGKPAKEAGPTRMHRAQRQRAVLKPAEMLIPRASLFYCSTFPAHPGLPSLHILNALQGTHAASRALYGAIFGRKAVRQLMQPEQRSKQRPGLLQERQWEAPRRIPAAQQPLVRALGQMLDRAKKCPYSLLLEHHCPLPPGIARSMVGHRRKVERRSDAGYQQESAVLPSLCCTEGEQPSYGAIHIFTQAPAGSLQAGKQEAMRIPDSCSDTPTSATVECSCTSQAAASANRLSAEHLSSAVVPHDKVTSFAWSVIRHIVPASLLGDPGNRRSLRRAVACMIRLRRYEQMSMQHALHRMRPTQMPALQLKPGAGRGGGRGAQAPLQQRLVLWVRWLLGDLLVPLLRAHFYCTESEAYRQEVFYYRKPVWLELQRQAHVKLRGEVYMALPAAEARSILQSRRLGIASLRLLPKKSGMRPIVNLGKGSRVTFRGASARRCRGLPAQHTVLSFRPVNFHLQQLHRVLKYETQRNKAALGCSVFGYNDAYVRLRPLLQRFQELRQSARILADAPQLFLVSADVSQAYDSINVAKLMDIVEPMLTSSQYLILKHAEVVPAAGSCLRTAIKMVAVDAAQACPAFPERAGALAQAARERVYTDRVAPARTERGKLLALLRQHLQDGLLRMGAAWYRQARGIPQGSTISTLLCSIFLGHLEQMHLLPLLSCHLAAPSPDGSSTPGSGLTALAQAAESASSTPRAALTGSLQLPGLASHLSTRGRRRAAALQPAMLRLVDDFLILTPSRAAAEAIVLRIMQGFPDYGVHMNPAKTKLSFDMRLGEAALPRNTYMAKDGQQFLKWCGLLINVRTMELQADYTRYAGTKLTASLTIPMTKEPGKALAAKLCAHLRPKCHALLLDAFMSSPTVVRRNVFQMTLLAAMKLHCQVMALPGKQRGRQGAVASAIKHGLAYLCGLVLRRTGGGSAGLRRRIRKGISACHIRWLGLKAFQRALSKKQGRYPEVLAALEAELRLPQYKQLTSQLADVIDPVQSAVFDDILF